MGITLRERLFRVRRGEAVWRKGSEREVRGLKIGGMKWDGVEVGEAYVGDGMEEYSNIEIMA